MPVTSSLAPGLILVSILSTIKSTGRHSFSSKYIFGCRFFYIKMLAITHLNIFLMDVTRTIVSNIGKKTNSSSGTRQLSPKSKRVRQVLFSHNLLRVPRQVWTNNVSEVQRCGNKSLRLLRADSPNLKFVVDGSNNISKAC